MNRFLILLSLFILQSCAPKMIPLTGMYGEPPYTFTTTSSKDSVWDKIIDLFAQKGLPIKIIDRSSGLIISDRAEFPFTIEDKDGSLKNPLAYIVLPKILNKNTNKYVAAYYRVTGEWNIRIKEQATGTFVNINIVNVKHESFSLNSARYQYDLHDYKSTGVFEKIITDYIK